MCIPHFLLCRAEIGMQIAASPDGIALERGLEDRTKWKSGHRDSSPRVQRSPVCRWISGRLPRL